MLTIELAGERLTLWAQRAISWPRRRTLLIADLHIGKSAAFRSAGLPTPEAGTQADLARLDSLVEASRAERLIVLGDLLHARAGRAPQTMLAVQEWALRATSRGVKLTLVRGNHDRSSGDPPPDWGFCAVNGPAIDGPFALCHEPQHCESDHYTLAGHLHPAAMLDCPSGAALRAPCFWFGPRVGVLPAFGSFTGSRAVRPANLDRVFVIGDGDVVEVSARASDAPA